MSQKFIGIDDAAAQLGVSKDRLNTLREAGELRAYRDGASWKFRTEEIDKLQSEGLPSGGEDDDVLDIEPLADGDDAESILLTDEDVDLSTVRPPSTIIGKADPDVSDSDLELASPGSESFANIEEVEIDLEVESSRILEPGDVAAAQKAAEEAKEGPKSDVALSDDFELDLLGSGDLEIEASGGGLSGDLTATAETPDPSDAGSEPGSSVLELSDDEQDDLVLGESSDDMPLATSDSGINLAPSDSGISLDDVPLDLAGSAIGSALDLAALSSVSEQSSPIDTGGASDDFQLTPVAEEEADEDSSQIVALEDISEAEVEADVPAFEEQPMASDLGDLSEADLGGVEFEAVGVSDADDDMDDDMDDGLMATGAPAAAAAATEQSEYPLWVMVGLGCTSFVMLLCAMMGLDLIQSIWAWDEPYSLNSSLIESITGMFGG